MTLHKGRALLTAQERRWEGAATSGLVFWGRTGLGLGCSKPPDAQPEQGRSWSSPELGYGASRDEGRSSSRDGAP